MEKDWEINTSSFKYGTGIWLPREVCCETFYKDLGGEILTFGSDSHDHNEHFLGSLRRSSCLAKKLGFVINVYFAKNRSLSS